MITYNDLVNDLKSLGIKEGDTLFLRISYRAIGKIENGPKTFLDALLKVVGEEGSIILVATPQRYNPLVRFFYKSKISSEEHLKDPSTGIGIMSKIALQYPSAMVSKKLIFPFVVIGKHAKYLTENHTREKDGFWLLREAVEKFDSKCLRIGGESLTGTTHLAFTDMLRKYDYYQKCVLYGLYIKENDKVKWQTEPISSFCKKGYKKMFDQLIYPCINKKEGKVGNGYAIVTNMRETLEKEREILFKNPKEILCEDDSCVLCRISLPFSNSHPNKFILNQFVKFDFKKWRKIYSSIRLITIGKKIQ